MTKKQAIEILKASSLTKFADEFSNHLLPSARIYVDDLQDGLCGSWFGGLPRLPKGVEWPCWNDREFKQSELARWELRLQEQPKASGLHDIVQAMREKLTDGPKPLTFLCQLSLSEIHSSTPVQGLPVHGTLVFFCEPETWGFDPKSRGHCKVVYVPEGKAMHELTPPADLPKELLFPKRTLSFKTEWTLPSYLLPDDDDSETWDEDEYQKLLSELMLKRDDNEPVHRCGGHPQEVQGEMRIECQLVTNGLYCGDRTAYQDPRYSQLANGAGEWQLLLQIDTDEDNMAWMWGDSGRIYFWARQQNIDNLDFDQCWSIVQCY